MGTSTLNVGVSPKDYHDMAVASVAREKLIEVMGHYVPGEPLKRAFPAIAVRLKMNVRRVRALWNLEARKNLRDDIFVLERELVAISTKQLKSGMHKHATRLEGYAAQLASFDPDLFREEIDQNRDLARRARAFCDGEA